MSSDNQELKNLTDEELMERYGLGELKAFEELHLRHAPKIYGFLLRKLGKDSRCDDIFQETFFRMHKYRRKYNASLPFLPWLFTICWNVLIDSKRKSRVEFKRQEHVKEIIEVENLRTELMESAEGTFQTFLDELSERERRVLTLHIEEGFSFQEVASSLKLSPGLARKISSRAIQKLRALWK